MVFVLDGFVLQLFVKSRRAFFEAVIIILAAVKINRSFPQARRVFPRKNEWAIFIPVAKVDWVPENGRKHLGERCAGLGRLIELLGRLGNERGALRADRGKQLRVTEGEAQRAVTAHGNPCDRMVGAALLDTIFRFDPRNKFLQKEIAITNGAIGRIDVKATFPFRRDDKEIAQLMLLAKIVEQRPTPAIEKCLLVVSQTVQKVKHGILLLRTPGCARIVACRKIDTVVNRIFQYLAVECVAIDPALSAQRQRERDRHDRQQNKNSEA